MRPVVSAVRKRQRIVHSIFHFFIIIFIISWLASYANRCSAMFYCHLLLLLFRLPPTLITLANPWNINTLVNVPLILLCSLTHWSQTCCTFRYVLACIKALFPNHFI